MSGMSLSKREAEADLAQTVGKLVWLYIERNRLNAEAKRSDQWLLELIPEITFIGWGKANEWSETEQRDKSTALQYTIKQTELEIRVMTGLRDLARAKSSLEREQRAARNRGVELSKDRSEGELNIEKALPGWCDLCEEERERLAEMIESEVGRIKDLVVGFQAGE